MKDAEKEIPNVSKLVTNGALNKKVREVENKITAVGILVTTSVLTLIRLRFLRVFFFFLEGFNLTTQSYFKKN